MNENDDRYDFYSLQYARFSGDLAAEIRREVYESDIGQQGWRTLEEQDDITALVGERPSCRFLDVACGSGGPSLETVRTVTGCRLTGVDIEAAGIAEANDRAVAMGLTNSTKFLVADCSEPLPFDDSTFDVIVCIDAVPHFADRNGVFRDWFRLLSPGGRLFLTDAAVLTGAVSRAELDVRASQGCFVSVPPGFNETSLSQAGFRLLKQVDTTNATADIANRTFAARRRREKALRQAEGAEWFEKRQAFLATTADLAASRRLSRFRYIAEKSA
jgi:ubiquinone/menaquinone biosynthesis C-methylase UbiE